MSWKFELLVDKCGAIAEGPAWDGSGLLFTLIQKCEISRWDPASKKCTTFRENTDHAIGLILDPDGKLYATSGGGRAIVRFEPDGSVTTIVDRFEGQRLNIPNDLAIDLKGRIWFTDPWYEGSAGEQSNTRDLMEIGHESVYRVDPQPDGTWTIHRVTFDTTRPNGILFSLDHKTLYVAQSGKLADEKKELRAYPVNDDGSLGEFKKLHDFEPHRGIDGMVLDTEGCIIATAGSTDSGPGPMIYVFAPEGDVLEQHPVPCYKPTNCSFGDADLKTLYVTAIDGELFSTRTERQGRLLYPKL
jgi:gluconolactonase